MERAFGGRVAVRVRDALALLAKSGRLTGIEHFTTLIEDSPCWHVVLSADGGRKAERRFALRLSCVVTERIDRTVSPSPLVLTVTRAHDGERYGAEFTIRMNRLSGDFRLDADAISTSLDEALKQLDVGD